jgi:uncharacterized membrane protein
MAKRVPTLLVATLVLIATGCADESVTAPLAAPVSPSADALASSGLIELGGLGHLKDGRANAIHSWPDGNAIVVGAVATVDTSLYRNEKAVYWDLTVDGTASEPVALGQLPDPFDDSHPYQVARDVNSNRVIVGESMYREGNTLYSQRTVGFVFDGKEMKLLPWLVGDTYAWFAWEVNEGGMVAGWIRYASERDEEDEVTAIATHGALWLSPYEDAPVLLEPLAGHVSAHARTINDDGIIAGWSWSGQDTVGVYWLASEAGSVTGPFPLADGFRSTAINAAGHVAGHASGLAAVWDAGTHSLEHLDGLYKNGYSQAFGINNGDGGAFRVVGWSGRKLDFDSRLPTIWDMAGGSTPMQLALPDDYSGGFASDVDERGWVVGVGYEKVSRTRSVWRAVVWLPAVGDGGDDEEPCDPHPRTGACR